VRRRLRSIAVRFTELGKRSVASAVVYFRWTYFCLLLAFSFAATSDAAFAQDAKVPDSASTSEAGGAKTDSPNNDFLVQGRLAEVLIVQNKFDEARGKLLVLEKMRPRDAQIQFLLGLLDMQDKDYDSAIDRFHRILVSEPNRVRVRLELGRAYFLGNDYENAERQFLFARAGHLPPAVQINVDRYLGAVRSLRTFNYNFSLSVASDTNLNAGPAIDTVSLYGLPFQLSQAAKANSGIGLAVDGGVEWAPRLNQKLKWRIGAQLHRSQYRQSAFNDMTVGLYTGPHFTWKRWDFNLLANANRRWYGDHVYSGTIGGSTDATYYVSPRIGVGAQIGVNHIGYPQNSAQNGVGRTFGVNFFFTPTPSSSIRGSAVFGQQSAQVAVYAYGLQQYGLSYTREFAGGITMGLTPTYSRIGYGAPIAAFGATRIDHQISAQLTLLDRRIDWHGLTPRIGYTYTRNNSSIDLYTFRRNRIEVGITKAF
jgi:tetratricopeptide (TPR) repeat protein